MNNNLDQATVEGFGKEWSSFSHENFSDMERKELFEKYFHIFPWHDLPENPEGADIGCGSGRWAMVVADKVHRLHLVDASMAALEVAEKNLSAHENIIFHHRSVGDLPFLPESLDFAYSLGVLHHVPDTKGAIRSIARALKPGAPCLIYLYYALDNRPLLYRMLWRFSDMFRLCIAPLPYPLRYAISQVIAMVVYFPLARLAKILDTMGIMPQSFPLAFYRHTSFYVMRTDALDRFGTRLEQRFSRQAIKKMLLEAGLENPVFSEKMPYWVAVAKKAGPQA